MKKEEAIRIVVRCAQQYKNNLENKMLLFVFGKSEKPQFLEVGFDGGNYLHLTGLLLRNNRPGAAKEFFRKCINNKLTYNDFDFNKDGTTEMKLSVIPQMMNIHNCARMIGDFNSTKILLETDKLAGSVKACMGFVEKDSMYFPNTILKEDIRNITRKPQQKVLAVFRKNKKDKIYTELCYEAKGISFGQLQLPKDIEERIAVITDETMEFADKKLELSSHEHSVQPHKSIIDRLADAKTECDRLNSERSIAKTIHDKDRGR